MDDTEMKKCPDVSDFKTLLAKTTPTESEGKQIEVLKQNKRMCAIITLGQESNHGMAVIKRTVETGVHPHGSACKFVSMLEEKHKPCDASAKIALTAELGAIPFKAASDRYDGVASVLARYDLSVSETDGHRPSQAQFEQAQLGKSVQGYIKVVESVGRASFFIS